MKLTEQDVKLLSYLYHSAREPITKIAKKCNLSREQVNYKLKKFQEEGLIKNFVTLFNYPKLGYNLWSAILIKSENKLNLNNIKNIINHSEIIGKYDYFITFVSKDKNELKQTIQEIIKENDSIKDYILINPYFVESFPLKFINNKDTFKIIEKSEKQTLTKDDIKILKILEKNARIKITEIANKLDISAELALYKLRKLQKNKIILGTKIHFDMTKLGFHYSLISISLFNFSEETEEKIKHLAKENPFIDSLLLSINQPQVVIQLFHKTQEELMSTIKEIKKTFGSKIKSLDIMFPCQEKELNTLQIQE